MGRTPKPSEEHPQHYHREIHPCRDNKPGWSRKSPLERSLLHLNPAVRAGKQNGAKQEEQPSPRCCWQRQGCHTSPGIPTLVTVQPERDGGAQSQGCLQLIALSTVRSAALAQHQAAERAIPVPQAIRGSQGITDTSSASSSPTLQAQDQCLQFPMEIINPSFPDCTLDSAELLWSLGREPQLWDWGDPKREGAAKDCRGAESSETCSE